MLEPPTVSAPGSLTIALTVVSGDGHAHRVVVRTPRPYYLSVAAGGRASVLIPALRAGQYVIDVDGAAHGALIVGVLPGP
jgi:hypothetical protein